MANTPRIEPTPTEEEAVAMAAAIEMMWPRPSAGEAVVDAPPRWRFSGRWWHRGVRGRPRPTLR